jgi:hypothetical protein
LKGDAAARLRLRPNARRLGQQAEQAVATGRNGLECLPGELGRRRRRRDVDDRRGSGHRNRFSQGADIQDHIEFGDEADRQPDVRPSYFLESSELVGDRVDADWQGRQSVPALRIGNPGDRGHLQRRAGRGHRDTGKYGAAFIGDLTDDAGAGGLGNRRTG